MRKFAVPATFVPGATPRIIGEGLNKRHVRDRKGRYIWNMPEPIRVHETLQVMTKVIEVDGKPKQIKVKEKVAFPVYRGMDASYARYQRSQARRAQRKLAEFANRQQDLDAAIALRDFVLNPGE